MRVPLLIDGDAGEAEGLVSTDPGSPERVVAEAGRAGPGQVAAAVEAATRGAREWGARTAEQRAEVLTAAADRLRSRRLELAALQVRECAKPWPEADADVCEAIDFLEYYARGAVELERGPELVQAPGERNTMAYRPRGVVGVISPWNFPLAIPCGMTAGALAAGNAVVLKPAEQSPGCALALAEALLERRAAAGGAGPGARRRRGRRRAGGRPARPRRSPSPARPRWAWRSSGGPPRRPRASRTSSTWWPRWAARTA